MLLTVTSLSTAGTMCRDYEGFKVRVQGRTLKKRLLIGDNVLKHSKTFRSLLHVDHNLLVIDPQFTSRRPPLIGTYIQICMGLATTRFYTHFLCFKLRNDSISTNVCVET